MSEEDSLDVTPSPAVLVTLTYNQLTWGDALCELVDNSIDSFSRARLQGVVIENPRVELFIPSRADVRDGRGYFMIRDNGPGLDQDGLRNALKAGYSANKRFGNLGLFGVGFNIATGKLGRKTTVTTFRESDEYAIEAVLDLQEMAENDEFKAPLRRVPKPNGFAHGTFIRVEGWWPSGNPNSDFALKVASQSQQSVLDLLGRRYATILDAQQSEKTVELLLYPDPDGRPDIVAPFVHCVWAPHREVQSTRGAIPAQIDIDEVLGNSRRCKHDGVLVPERNTRCPMCNRSEIITIEHRVRGWVGIQRYDSIDDYGIDLIRNGRTIRTQEKEAFFYWTEEDGRLKKEYPVDDQTGRIVGQIHLDHVPVDFMKQDFERASQEWVAAIRCIRGEQLLPGSWPEGYTNESPISRLQSGYKRIRDFGRKSMYMGRWDTSRGKAVRISREIEQEYLEKFRKRIPGYFDDAEWWKLVESADQPPPPPSEECPNCHFRHLPDAEVCEGCGDVLRGKYCIHCNKLIPLSAITCPDCGETQVAAPNSPWNCNYCGSNNSSEVLECSTCALPIGSPSPVATEVLERESSLIEDYSRSDLVIELPDGRQSEPLEITTRQVSRELRPRFGYESVPVITDKTTPNKVSLYVDLNHRLFKDLGVRVVDVVAGESAQYLYTKHTLAGQKSHSLSALTALILASGWGRELSQDSVDVVQRLQQFTYEIASRFADSDSAVEFYRDLPNESQQLIVRAIFDANEGRNQTQFTDTGRYLTLAPRRFLADFFVSAPGVWFETVWNVDLPTESQVGRDAALEVRERQIGSIERCLRDIADVLDARDPESVIGPRSESAVVLLESLLR